MELNFKRRADIAFRSLQPSDRKPISRALEILESTDRSTLVENSKFRKLVSGLSSKKYFVYEASKNLRFVLSFENNICIIEDILDSERLSRMLNQGGLK